MTKSVFFGTKQLNKYHIIVTTHKGIVSFVFDKIIKYGHADQGPPEEPKYYLTKLDPEGNFRLSTNNSRNWIFSSKTIRPFTIDEIEDHRRVFDHILDKLDNYNNLFIMHTLEHHGLVNCDLFYPVLMLESFERANNVPNNEWTREIIPSYKKYLEKPTKYSFGIGRLDDYWEKRFRLLCSCLYSSEEIASIEVIQSSVKNKSNIFLVRITFIEKCLSPRYEIVKIDTIYKIEKEIKNFKKIITNYLSNTLYQVKGSTLFCGEFMGAIRSCAETRFNPYTFPLITLKDKILSELKRLKRFKTVQENIEAYIDKIIKRLQKLHQLGQVHESNNKAFIDYSQRILPPVLDIRISAFDDIRLVCDNKKLSRIDPYGDTLNFPDKGIFKIIEIKPNIDVNDAFCLILEAQHIKDKQFKFKLQCFLDAPEYIDWKVQFHKQKIKEGRTVRIKLGNNTKQDNSKSSGYLNRLCDIVNRDGLVTEKVSPLLERIHLKTQSKATSFQNPLNIFYDVAREKFSLMKESLSIAHGDLNLDNILIHENPSTNENDCQYNNQFEVEFIDLASFSTDFPLSYDYVKFETELKNHILAEKLCAKLGGLKDNLSRNQMHHIKSNFLKAVISYERSLSTKAICPCVDTHLWTNEMILFFPILSRIRDAGYKLYEKRNDFYIDRFYMQQLFFYSLRTLTFEETKNNNFNMLWARRWSFVAAMIAVEILTFEQS